MVFFVSASNLEYFNLSSNPYNGSSGSTISCSSSSSSGASSSFFYSSISSTDPSRPAVGATSS